MVPGNSDGIPRVPPYSGVLLTTVLASVRGLHPLRRAVPDASVGLPVVSKKDPITPALASRQRRFGLLPVRSPLLGESFLLSSPAGTKMFQFPAFASRSSVMSGSLPTGCPIRISVGLRAFAPRHGFSQLVTSFFASESLGIPHAPFICPVFPLCIFCPHPYGGSSGTVDFRLLCLALQWSRACARDARLLYSFVCFSLAAASPPKETPMLPSCHRALPGSPWQS